MTAPDFRSIRRVAMVPGVEPVVEQSRVTAASALPAMFHPRVAGVRLAEWARSHRHAIDAAVHSSGGALFRGFAVCEPDEFHGFMEAACGELLEYKYRSTPRHEVTARLYTSTEYPAGETIPQHNELAYTNEWPLRIGFYCHQPSNEGGETPLSDSRGVLRRLRPEVVARFRSAGVRYVRNYGLGLDLSWGAVFQTDDRSEVEAQCRERGIQCEWDRDRLRTIQICQALAMHPVTGEEVWFNQAHLFHVSSLGAEVQAEMLSVWGEANLPRNAYYGDGERIEPAVLDHIRDAFAQETVAFPWQASDVLLLDNMLAAHGRKPFLGPRRILVGMAQPFSPQRSRL
jgi:alpha-ketoglutarate-dependent taurine dioxygenase